MKTIEEAAIEYSEIEIFDGNNNDSIFTSRLGLKMIYERVFKSGVEFAQRWIPASEEQPEHRKVVLVKVPLINYPLLFCYDQIRSKWYQFDDGDFYESEVCPTHWRPIERS